MRESSLTLDSLPMGTSILVAMSSIDVAAMTLTPVVDNSPADGATNNQMLLQAFNSDGGPVNGAAISWSVTGSGTLLSNSSVTNEQGQATVYLTNTVAEPVDVTATATAGGVSVTKPSSFVRAVATLDLAVSKDGSVANGQEHNEAVVTVLDAQGKAMADVDLSWAVDNDAVIANAGNKTDANGQATVSFSNSKAGAVKVSVEGGGKSAEADTSFVKIPIASMVVSIIKNGAVADGKTVNQAQVLVTSAGNVPMAGVSITWSLDKATASATTPLTVTTDAKGIATLDLTDTVAETVGVTATAEGASNTASANFVAVPVEALSVTISQDNAVADGAAINRARALVTSANNTPMPNTVVTWSLGSSTATATSALTVTTDADGYAELSFTDSVVEIVRVTATATAGGSTVSGSSTARFIPIPVDQVALSITQNNAVADGVATNQAQVLVTSAGGVPMANTAVTWSLSSSTATATTSLTGMTDSAGIAILDLTDTLVELVTITATAGGKSDSGDARFIRVPVDSIAVSISKDNSPADGASANIAEALVLDSNGNPMAGVDVNWTVSGSATLQSTTTQTNASGIAQVQLTDTVGENVVVSGKAGTKTDTATATFTVLPVDRIVVSMITDNAPADGVAKNKAKAVVTNSLGAPMAGVVLTWTVDGNAVLAGTTSTTDGNGEATIELTDITAESVTVTASADGKTGSSTANFVTAPAADIVVTIDPNNAPANGVTENVAKALVTDTLGNPKGNFNVNWSIVTGSAHLAATSSTTDANGIATVGLTDTVAETVRVRANGGSLSGEADATFDPVRVDKLVVTITSNNAEANGSALNTAEVLVTSAGDIPMAGTSVTWALNHATAHATTPLTVTTGPNGKATLSFTDSVAETVTVSASAGGKSGQADAVFSPVVIASITTTMDVSTVKPDGQEQAIARAVVKGSGGQLLSGVEVHWAVTGSAHLLSGTSVTGSNGAATVALTNTVAEAVTVTASVGALSDYATARFQHPADKAAYVTFRQTGRGSQSDQAIITVTVFNSAGATMANVPVEVGWPPNPFLTCIPGAPNTNVNGEISISCYTSSIDIAVIFSAAVEAASSLDPNNPVRGFFEAKLVS